MIKELMPYYRRHFMIALASGLLLGVLLGQWQTGVVVAVWMIAYSIWAPHSGVYVVDASGGANALREDERSRWIRARAAEIGLLATVSVAACAWFVVRAAGQDYVPHSWLVILVVLGVSTQIVAGIVLRRQGE